MKRISLLIVVGLVLFLGGAYSFHIANLNSSKGVALKENLKLSQNELFELKKDALGGSVDAASKLWKYCAMYVGDDKQTMYWAQIAAENGSANNARDYASFLADDKNNLLGLIRARFWAQRAIERGLDSADNLLPEIENSIQKLESGKSKEPM